MSYAEIGLSDQRVLEISHQVKDRRAGQKMIPPLLTGVLPKEWRRAVLMKLNPPSLLELAAEVASSLRLKVFEQYFFELGFAWRANNQEYFGVRDDPNLLQRLKQAEGSVKNMFGLVTRVSETHFPDQNSLSVYNWLETSRKAGANLGTAFCSPTTELTMLKQQILKEAGDINDSREKVPSDVRTYLDSFKMRGKTSKELKEWINSIVTLVQADSRS